MQTLLHSFRITGGFEGRIHQRGESQLCNRPHVIVPPAHSFIPAVSGPFPPETNGVISPMLVSDGISHKRSAPGTTPHKKFSAVGEHPPPKFISTPKPPGGGDSGTHSGSGETHLHSHKVCCWAESPLATFVTMNASLSGWRALLEGRGIRGLQRLHINCLKLLVGFLALRHFLLFLQGHPMLMKMDSTTVVACMDR